MRRYARVDPPEVGGEGDEFALPAVDLLMDLETFWFCLIAVVWAMYFLLEGFDFGVGMLLPFVPRSDEERSTALRTIGPVWDGNEVWLVVAGGATFAAFPAWYATMFSGFYLALLLILVLPHRPRRLVRVALEERDARLARDVDVGEHDRQLRRLAPLGDRAVVPRVRRPDRLRRRLRRRPSGISSARTRCSPASRSCCSSRSTARRSSRCARPASFASRSERAARRLAIPAALAVPPTSSGRSRSRWTATTRISSRRCSRRSSGSRPSRSRCVFVFTRSQRAGVRDDRARRDRRSSRRCSRASTRA